MPSKAMKPTEAGTDRYSSVNHRATMPPIIAKGTLVRTKVAWRTERKVLNSSRKIKPIATGTTIDRRLAARC